MMATAKKINNFEESSNNINPGSNHQKTIDDIRLKIESLRDYTPKVGVFGNSGVGKSSLCNALFGKEVAKIADVEACTRKPQEILIGGSNGVGGIILVDVPGIGEDPIRQREYTNLYKSLVPELDLVLWAIKADDRNYASGIDAYTEIFGKKEAPPVIFVITQTDKTNDSDDWDHQNYEPSGSQIFNVAIKENDVSRRFSISVNRIKSIAISAKKMSYYNIKELVSLIVEVLPNEKKYSFTREAKSENVTEEARKSAEKGIWDSVKEFAGNAWDSVKGEVVTVMISSAPKIIKSIKSWLSSW